MILLEIYLTPLGHDPKRFHATTSQSVAGEGWADSDLPFWEGDKDWRSPIIKVLEGSGAFNPKHFPNPGEQDWLAKLGILNSTSTGFHSTYLQQIGGLLYQSLLPLESSLRSAFQSALRLAERDDTELHLRFKFSADSAVRSRLADYPWELLHDGQRFLQERHVRISRYIAYESLPPNLQPQDQVRVLLVSSRPHDPGGNLATLSNKEEMEIREELEEVKVEGHIILESLPQATFDAFKDLTQRTSEQMPQVVHFDGHGLFGKCCANPQCKRIHPGIKADRCRSCGQALEEPTGFLIFEDSEGKPEYVSARSFAAALPSETALVVLSACQSGMAVAGRSVFNGTAQQLIDARTPAVVAMQYAVQDGAASCFAKQFYRVLGQRKTVMEAINQGQLRMGFGGNQWYRPVVYLRLLPNNPHGNLFTTIPKKQKVKGDPIPDTSNFKGRTSELTQLKKSLQESKVINIYGTPGIGKSLLAAKYIRDCQMCEAIWIDTAQYSSYANFAKHLLKILDSLEQVESIEEKKLSNTVIGKLQSKEIILIIDQLNQDFATDQDDSEREYVSLLEKFIKSEQHSKIIVTSREKISLDKLAKAKNLHIKDGLSPEEGKAFLSSILACTENEKPQCQDLKTIAKYLWGNPRALEIVGDFLQSQDTKLQFNEVGVFKIDDILQEVFKKEIARGNLSDEKLIDQIYWACINSLPEKSIKYLKYLGIFCYIYILEPHLESHEKYLDIDVVKRITEINLSAHEIICLTERAFLEYPSNISMRGRIRLNHNIRRILLRKLSENEEIKFRENIINYYRNRCPERILNLHAGLPIIEIFLQYCYLKKISKTLEIISGGGEVRSLDSFLKNDITYGHKIRVSLYEFMKSKLATSPELSKDQEDYIYRLLYDSYCKTGKKNKAKEYLMKVRHIKRLEGE